MPDQYWRAPLPPFHIVDGTALANSVTLTDISPTPQITIPGLTFLAPGREFELEASGQFSTTATPTLLLGFYYGAVAGLALAASSAVTTGTATAWPWRMRYRGRVRAVGTSGQIQGQGEFLLGTSLTAFSLRAIPETAAARTVTVDTSIAKAITVGAQWGAASASNTITCNIMSLDFVN